MSRLTDALDERFTDLSEVKDIAKYGMEGGFADFIYYGDIRRFFFEHENDIESYIEDHYGYKDWITSNPPYSVNNLINNSVWLVVQSWCTQRHDAITEGDELDAA